MAQRRSDDLQSILELASSRINESPDDSNATEKTPRRLTYDETSRRLPRVLAHKGDSDDELSIESGSTETLTADEDGESSCSGSDHRQLEESAAGSHGSADELDIDSSSEISDEEAASISFGALAKAQSSLGKRKRGAESSDLVQPSFPSDARSRHNNGGADAEALERKAGKKDNRDFSRPSKHAPAEISSKKAVSRKRGVVPIPKREIRDPRFESLSGPLNNDKIKKNYAFLDTYRESEIAELKAGLRKTKDLAARETLKRALTSMESRKKTEELKKQRQEVLRRHRREEKERVEKGKKPFYLKRGTIQEKILVERFEGMKGKQIEKVIERRRKKQTAKERRGMPFVRRG